jgi:hypothetical protein
LLDKFLRTDSLTILFLDFFEEGNRRQEEALLSDNKKLEGTEIEKAEGRLRR